MNGWFWQRAIKITEWLTERTSNYLCRIIRVYLSSIGEQTHRWCPKQCFGFCYKTSKLHVSVRLFSNSEKNTDVKMWKEHLWHTRPKCLVATFLTIFQTHRNIEYICQIFLYHRYDEVCSHNFYDEAYQDKSGHFSQLVWNATRELGVGKAMGTKFGMNCTFIVARYRPLGNIGSEFAHDVTKGNFDSSYCSNVQRDVLPHHGAGKPNTASRKYRYRTKIPRFPKVVIL